MFNLNEMIFLIIGPNIDLEMDKWHYCKTNALINNYFIITAFLWTCVIAWSVK